MPAPATVEEFLELLPKSGVLDVARVEEYLRPVRAAGALPRAPAQLADLLIRDGLLTRFQGQQLLLGKYRGFAIGNYQVLELLGAGGMSAVYLCLDRARQRRVALKVLPRSLAKDPTLLKRFEREARAMTALDHPNIVRGFDAGSENDQHFFVMEFVEGASLQEIVRKQGPMPVNRAAHYVRQAAVGLQHAHEQGLIHRDIKPGNLLVDRQGVVKILDMGLSRFYNEEDSILTKDVLGTLDYLAPEQARDSHTVDIRADIYSLGATFYFLLSGRTPLDQLGNLGNLDPRLLSESGRLARPIRALRPEVPEAVGLVMAKMMAQRPEQRYQVPAEVVEALAPWAIGPAPPPTEEELPQLSPAARSAGNVEGVYGGPLPSRKKPWLMIAGALLVVVVGAVVSWALLRG